MNLRSPWIWLTLTIVLQLGALGWLIGRWEMTIAQGEIVKFVCAPYDPYDPFRGRYVSLRLESNSAPVHPDLQLTRGDRIYAVVDVDADGFATFESIETTRPADRPYLRTQFLYFHFNSDADGRKEALITLPFERYFLNERLAPEAESAYAATLADEESEAWLEVALWNGEAVGKQLYLNGHRIEDVARQRLQDEAQPDGDES